MADLISLDWASSGLKGVNELVKSSKEIDENVPRGLTPFIGTVYGKSKRLALPIIIVGSAAAGIATGGIAAAPFVLGICGGSIQLLNIMRDIYRKKFGHPSSASESKADQHLKSQIGGFAEDISKQISKMETSIQFTLNDINLSLQNITRKLNDIILKPDKEIEAAFRDIQAKLKDKRYDSALKSLKNYNLDRMRLESHVMKEKAEELITNEFKENGKEGALKIFYDVIQTRQKLELLIQMQHFLTDLQESGHSSMEMYIERDSMDYLNDLEGYWDISKILFITDIKIPTVLVLGKCGTGKSSLCNILAGLAVNADSESDGFRTSPGTEACTQMSTLRETCYFGDTLRPVRIIDTPGFDDPNKNQDAKIITNCVEVLKNEVYGVNLILLVLNGHSPRLEGSLLEMIQIIRGMFTTKIWNHLAVVFTRVSMDSKQVAIRNRNDPDHDKNVAEGFLKTIRDRFGPPQNSKKLEYLYMDAHFVKEDEIEKEAIEKSKEKLWKMIDGNEEFNTNYVEAVFTEYASLKEELKKRDSEMTRTSTIIRHFEQNELNRIQRENKVTRTPVNGLTFLKFSDYIFSEKPEYAYVRTYTDLIHRINNGNPNLLENAESFCDTIRDIERQEDCELDFVVHQCEHLQSESLMQRIPRKHPSDKVSQMVFILEITNYTDHFLKKLDIVMTDGFKHPLAVWNSDESILAKPSVLACHGTFFIPPYTKERLIFRNSGLLSQKKLAGIMTLNIVGNKYDSKPEKKMMVQFKITGSTNLRGSTTFSVGFSGVNDNIQNIKKTSEEAKQNICAKINFPRNTFCRPRFYNRLDKNFKKGCTKSEKHDVTFPSNPVPGGFKVTGVFGQGNHSRGVVILSKERSKKQ